ncbi:MAG TPA: DinB family protein [Gemmatimonadales bacterium]
MTDPLLMELDAETQTTRRVLERIPEDKLSWKPHPRSYSLGQLGLHTASVPGALAGVLTPDSMEPRAFSQAEAKNRAEMMSALDDSVATARTMITGLTPERANFIWKMSAGGKDIIAAPRIALVRALMFNHWYHHRGQLLVYLRLLEVPVPSVYGPTADENPFM